MSDIVERLRIYATDDHERGCQGRCYDCSCGYDDKRDPLLKEAADEIERLRAALKWIAANTYGYEPHAMSDEEAKVYFANLFFAAQGKARAALANDVRITAQPAAPGGDA